MILKNFPLDEIKEVWMGTETDTLKLVEEGKWSVEGDFQHLELIFFEKETPDVFWSYVITRSGSPYTDYHYEWGEDYQTKMCASAQVEKRERIVTEWVAI